MQQDFLLGSSALDKSKLIANPRVITAKMKVKPFYNPEIKSNTGSKMVFGPVVKIVCPVCMNIY